MRRLLLLFLCLVPGVVFAQNSDPAPLGKGELFGLVGGAKFEGSTTWTSGAGIGFAYDAFQKPQVPLLFEYVSVVSSAGTTLNGAVASINFVGGGLRFGGSAGAFGSFVGGFAKLTSEITQTTGGVAIDTGDILGGVTTTVTSSVTRPGLSFAGGMNLPVRPHWGIRVEVRGTTIKDVNAWMYGVSGGAYYRFGKK